VLPVGLVPFPGFREAGRDRRKIVVQYELGVELFADLNRELHLARRNSREVDGAQDDIEIHVLSSAGERSMTWHRATRIPSALHRLRWELRPPAESSVSTVTNQSAHNSRISPGRDSPIPRAENLLCSSSAHAPLTRRRTAGTGSAVLEQSRNRRPADWRSDASVGRAGGPGLALRVGAEGSGTVSRGECRKWWDDRRHRVGGGRRSGVAAAARLQTARDVRQHHSRRASGEWSRR